MRDEEIGQVELLLQVLQEVDHLRLNRYIEGGNRFVTNYELRIQRKGSCDTDSLSLSARELVGIPSLMERLQAALIHNLINILFVLVLWYKPVFLHRFSDNLPDRKSRRQGREGILENNLHLGTHLVHFFFRDVVDFFSVE